MNSILPALEALLTRFDDEAFTALANRGLLRRARKDLEQLQACIAEQTDQYVIIKLGEQQIRFDARGPANAECSCPAAGICQHILAAAISLQAMAKTSKSFAPDNMTVEDGQPTGTIAPLHQALLAMPHAELLKHAGKPGYLWAWRFVRELDLEQDVTIAGDRHIVISFRQPRVTLRYMGGALGDMVADLQTSMIKKQQVAAALAYRRLHGLMDAAPDGCADSIKAAEADAGVPRLHDSRERLRAGVRGLLEDCLTLGVSHLSGNMHERFSTLAVWAQGVSYHRLTLLLRRMADHIELLIERTGGADSLRFYDEMSLAYGLTAALDSAAKQGLEPDFLLGQARGRYDDRGAMELLGLGAYAWRSGSGYLGLTLLFWSAKDQSFYSGTDARPEPQRAFNPRARYKAPGPWNGLGAPEQATGRLVSLRGAQVNADGRLSTAESIVAHVRPAENLAGQLKPHSRWSDLIQCCAPARLSLLAAARPMDDWKCLAPAKFGNARFDTVRQVLIWPIYDVEGEKLDMELAYSEFTEHAIRRIEQLAKQGLPKDVLLIAKIRGTVGGLLGEPLSIVRRQSGNDENPVDALHFDAAAEQNSAYSGFSALFRGKPGTFQPDAESFTVRQPPFDPGFEEFKHWLQKQAERGCATHDLFRLKQEYALQTEQMASNGYTAIPVLTSDTPELAALLLQANYIRMQYERSMDHPPLDETEL